MPESFQTSEPVAVIDVGTNSVKLLVASIQESAVEPLYETSAQTRLGAGFYESRILRQDAIQSTASVVSGFVETAKSHHATRIVCVGTSAARDAINSAVLVQALWIQAGIKLRVLTGDEEAELAFQGVLSDTRFDQGNHLTVDVGGGSTELVFGHRAKILARRSFPLGAVRLAEQLPLPESPGVGDYDRCRTLVTRFLRDHLLPFLKPHIGASLGSGSSLISACGTSSILARMHSHLDSYDRDRLDGCRIPAAALTQWCGQLWSTPLSSRRQIRGLPPDRADIMPFGALIFDCLLDALDVPLLTVSLRGLRFGLAARMALASPNLD